jgi:hypothetical protein
MTCYGLIRGGQWVVAPPRRRGHKVRIPAQLIHRASGEPLWLPGLTFGPAEQAWTTTSHDLAMARAAMLPLLPGGWRVDVLAWPEPGQVPKCNE